MAQLDSLSLLHVISHPPAGYSKRVSRATRGHISVHRCFSLSANVIFTTVLTAKAIHMTKHSVAGPTKGHGHRKAGINSHCYCNHHSSHREFLISEVSRASPGGSSVQLVLSPGCQTQRPLLRHNLSDFSVTFDTRILPFLKSSSLWTSTHHSPDPILPSSSFILILLRLLL